MAYKHDQQSTSNLSANEQLKQIQRKSRDLRNEVHSLRRFAQQQSANTQALLNETAVQLRRSISCMSTSDIALRMERIRISGNCDSYNDDVARLDKDLLELEAQVEELRSNVINRRCRVNMSNVESMAMILSRASKTVADLKSRYPAIAQTLKKVMTQELMHIEKEEV